MPKLFIAGTQPGTRITSQMQNVQSVPRKPTLAGDKPQATGKTLAMATQSVAVALADKPLTIAQQLRAAADKFADSRKDACMSLAGSWEKYGSHTRKQQKFAASLLRQASTPIGGEIEYMRFPTLAALFREKFAKMVVGELYMNLSICKQFMWMKWNDVYTGKLHVNDGRFVARMHSQALVDRLKEIDANPLATAKKYGLLQGRCCMCGLTLTNEESIRSGIGPICAGRM